MNQIWEFCFTSLQMLICRTYNTDQQEMGFRLHYAGAERTVSKVSRNFRFKMAFDFYH